MGLLFIFIGLHDYMRTYYCEISITDKEIILLKEIQWFKKEKKRSKEIYLIDNISYVNVFEDSLEIIMRTQEKKTHYSGEEKEYLEIEKGDPYILIYFNNKEELEKINSVLDYLKVRIPLKTHQVLYFLYYVKNDSDL